MFNTSNFRHPLRLRTGKIGLETDMKQAFLQTNIAEEHWDYLRFIWLQEFNLDENVILHFSLFLLNATVKLNLKKFLSIDRFKKFIKKLLLNLYVDDLNNGFDNIKDAIHFYNVSKTCSADGNFNFHKWATNCDELGDFISTQSHPFDVQNTVDQTYVKTESGASEKDRKILGLLIPTSLSLNLTV